MTSSNVPLGTTPGLLPGVSPRKWNDVLCSRCKTWQPPENFYPNPRERSGRTSHCKACHRQHMRDYQSRPEVKKHKHLIDKEYRSRPQYKAQARRRKLVREYNLTPEEWQVLFASQWECCGICQSVQPMSKDGWQTDHDHETGVVRGILCKTCNADLLPAYERLPQRLQDSPTLNAYLAKGKARTS